MKVLLLTDGVGPAEGQLTAALRGAGHTVEVFDVGGGWLTAPRQRPFWFTAAYLGHDRLRAGYLEDGLRSRGIDRVISSGLGAGAHAARHLSHPYVPLMRPADLNFSVRRRSHVDGFRALVRSANRLFLTDGAQSAQAAGLGSGLPHHQMPRWELRARPVLDRTSRTPRVAVVAAPGAAAEAPTRRTQFERFEATDLYTANDAAGGVSLHDAVKSRLGSFTHVVLAGTTPHSAALLEALRADADRVLVEGTPCHPELAAPLGYREPFPAGEVLGAVDRCHADRPRGLFARWLAPRKSSVLDQQTAPEDPLALLEPERAPRLN